jgi:hypothetical protein
MTARVRGRVVLYFPAKRAGVCPACAQRFSAGTAIYGPRGGPYCHDRGSACWARRMAEIASKPSPLEPWRRRARRIREEAAG